MDDAVVAELVEFTGLTREDVEARVSEGVYRTARVFREWPGEPEQWYRETDAYLFELADNAFGEFYQAIADRLVAGLGERTGPLHVLEYGCGIGCFALTLADSGFAVTACDLNDWNTKFLQFRVRRRGHRDVVRIVSPEESLSRKEGYHIISCQHVLEHVPDPLGMLRRFHDCLIPSGVFFGAAPFDLVGPDFPEHVPENAHLRLEDLCAEAGFQVLSTSPYATFDQSTFTLVIAAKPVA